VSRAAIAIIIIIIDIDIDIDIDVGEWENGFIASCMGAFLMSLR
jgi:hypothetical protein